MESSKKRVLITGVTGYLGSHVCKVFLENGLFHVRGSVRDLSDKDKLGRLKTGLGEELFSNLELVELELLNEEQIDNAVDGCSYVVHIASPCPMK